MSARLPPDRRKSAIVCVAIENAIYDELYAEAQQLGEKVPEIIRRAILLRRRLKASAIKRTAEQVPAST